MKQFCHHLFLFIIIVATSGCSDSVPEETKLISFNLKYDGDSDDINDWSARKQWVTDYLKFQNADIVGTQELESHQIDDILNELPQYNSIGVARDDGKTKGEYTAIFYRTDKYDLVDQKTFWLSETPNRVGVKGWGSAYNRVCTWAKFKRKSDNTIFFVFNTHFDNVSTTAQYQSALLIGKMIETLCDDEITFLMGDFNVNTRNNTYKVLSSDIGLIDTRVSAVQHYGPNYTYNGFGKYPISEDGNIIDHIFSTPTVSTLKSRIDIERTDKQFISDHYPVIVDVLF